MAKKKKKSGYNDNALDMMEKRKRKLIQESMKLNMKANKGGFGSGFLKALAADNEKEAIDIGKRKRKHRKDVGNINQLFTGKRFPKVKKILNKKKDK